MLVKVTTTLLRPVKILREAVEKPSRFEFLVGIFMSFASTLFELEQNSSWHSPLSKGIYL